MSMHGGKQRGRLRAVWLWVTLTVLFSLTGCAGMTQETVGSQEVIVGDPVAGRVALQAYGCTTCHHVPGVVGTESYVGPPLDAWAERSYIAGSLPNEPEHLVQWIRFPQAIEPGTAMPNLDVTEEDAANMGAYLYTLRSDQTWYVGMMRFLRIND